jgi:opacity protein-like surface antigen
MTPSIRIVSSWSVSVLVAGLVATAVAHAETPAARVVGVPSTAAPKSPRTIAAGEPYGAGYEDWKWPLAEHEWTAAVLPGVGIINNSAGFTLQGAIAKKIMHQGFAPDMNNQVFVEVQAGPYTTGGGSALLFSTHLRWDFTLNGDWTFYALGGLGGNATSERLGNQFQLLPRFGVGGVLDIERQTHAPIGIRGELSRELIGIGVQFRI